MEQRLERLAQAKQIFADALEQAAAQRPALLEAACAGDVELRAMVSSLLDAHAAASRFMDSPSTAPEAAAAALATRTEQPGASIGPYKLLEQIGEGGFGVVFMAEQTKPVVRRVALKVIKLGMDTRQVIARFEAERQALAMMDHPNIARVLDAGATEAGRPYFVMELVRGDPITEYCDKNNLTTGERLALFTDVCHAVQHAHQKGIIHRDIKSSNVLVTMFDGRPIPKVIDFGIAKAMNQRLTDKTLFTAHRQLIGTPQYMSPEQAEMSGVDIDTRSDIYSLGVLLYELLTGTTPFDPEHLRSAALAEVQRIIREEEPPKPSTRLSEGAKASKPATPATPHTPDTPSIAAHRRTDASQLVRTVRGDLDWIVMKCLEKDRTRRYETANGLALDLQRHVTGEPVMAVPPSRAYRLRKFARRNRGVLTTGVLLALSLLAGLAGTTAFALREQSARAEADRKREEAEAATTLSEQRREETERIAEFQAQMLNSFNASEAGADLLRNVRERQRDALAQGGIAEADRAAAADALDVELARVNGTDLAISLIARIILQPAVRAIDAQFKDQPAVDATLRQAISNMYWNLGLFDASVPLQESALATRRRVLGDDDPITLESMYLGSQRLSNGAALAQEMIERRRRVLGPRHPDTLAALTNAAMVLQSQGRNAEAEARSREAVDGFRGAPDHLSDLVGALDILGTALAAQGRFSEAEPYMQEMLDTSRRFLGNESARTSASISAFGNFLFDQQRFTECEPYAREALALSRRVWGDDHPNTLSAVWNVGFLLVIIGRPADAEPYYRELLGCQRRVMGDNHRDTLFSINSLGILLLDLDRPEEGEPLLREAAERRNRVLGPEHPDTLTSLKDLGRALAAEGKLDEAERLLRETLETSRRVLGESDTTIRCNHALGQTLLQLGRAEEAESLLRAAVDGYVATMGDNRSGTVRARTTLGLALTSLARFPEAESELLRAQEAALTALGATPANRRQCVAALVTLYESWNTAEPGKGYDAKAGQWHDRLAAGDEGQDGPR